MGKTVSKSKQSSGWPVPDFDATLDSDSSDSNHMAAKASTPKPLTRKEKRKAAKQEEFFTDALLDLSESDDCAISFELASTSMAGGRPLLIVALGNPGPQFASTYHNAGQIVASALQRRLTELPPSWQIRQSTSYMNVSGPTVSKIAKKTLPAVLNSTQPARLIVLHDDLERPLGSVRVRTGASSAQGHNGVKSIQQSLPVGTEWWRVAVGIGRPESRDKRAVSDWVLSRMSESEKQKLEGSVDRVVAELGKLAAEG